ncbi:MAG: RNA 2',3'-cyclic phosphodiesterase [Chthoniobacterales bacterium]
MPAKRLFVSLELPETIAAALVRLDPHLPGVRWLKAEQIHLTLAFLGQVDPETEEKLRANLRAIHCGAFFLSLQSLGTFPTKGRPKILWLGVGHGHPHLFQLHKKVTDAALAAGLDADLRPWHPHITLARCENVSAQLIRPFLRKHTDFDAGLVQVSSFQLKSSLLLPTGSIHTTELTVGL